MKIWIAAAICAATACTLSVATTPAAAQQMVTSSDGTYTLKLISTVADEAISFGLWDPPSYVYVNDISLTTGGGPNLLYLANWQDLGGPGFCCSGISDDGSQAGVLASGSYGPYTVFRQAVSGLTPGALYDLTYTISNSYGYSQDAAVSVPEPAAWGLMLLGLGLAGAAVRGRRVAVSS
jgi:hypothetical protein